MRLLRNVIEAAYQRLVINAATIHFTRGKFTPRTFERGTNVVAAVAN
jgi:hypothetical protein